MQAEQLLTQLIGPLCAAESIASAKKAGMSLADWVSEAVSRTDEIGASAVLMSDAERRALEFIADKDGAEVARDPHVRLEEVSYKILSMLNLLKSAYEVSRREDKIHDQRFIGLLLLGDGLEEELLAASDLIHKEAHMLKAQRTALRALAGRQLTEKDDWRLRCAEEFKLARTLTRDEMPAKEGQAVRVKGAKLIELARALQREIRSTSEDGFTAEQNGEISDMETTLHNFIEIVEGKCAVDATARSAAA